MQVNWVVNGEAQQHSDKLESDWGLVWKSIEPVNSAIVFGQEHVQVRIEDSFGDELEILIFDSTFVTSFFSNERNSEGCLKIFDFIEFLHTVIQDIVSVDFDVQVNESLEAEIVVLDHGAYHSREAGWHGFLDVEFLFQNWLNLQ